MANEDAPSCQGKMTITDLDALYRMTVRRWDYSMYLHEGKPTWEDAGQGVGQAIRIMRDFHDRLIEEGKDYPTAWGLRRVIMAALAHMRAVLDKKARGAPPPSLDMPFLGQGEADGK